jgi:hypothetical protein
LGAIEVVIEPLGGWEKTHSQQQQNQDALGHDVSLH